MARFAAQLTLAVAAVIVLWGLGCGAEKKAGGPSEVSATKPAEPKAASSAPSGGGVAPASDAKWPGVRGGHYVRWLGRTWNTRKPARVSEAGGVGTLGQRNGTGTYLGEERVNAGTVELDVKFDAGYLAAEGGGKHFLEIMSWIADRSDRKAVGAKPWSRIELARLGGRPRCLVWNYGPQFRGQATRLFTLGPALKPERWYHIRFDWSYKAPAGRITIHVDDRSYSSAFRFVAGTAGPGRYFLFGHVETTQPQGRLHFRNFKVAPAAKPTDEKPEKRRQEKQQQPQEKQ